MFLIRIAALFLALWLLDHYGVPFGWQVLIALLFVFVGMTYGYESSSGDK